MGFDNPFENLKGIRVFQRVWNCLPNDQKSADSLDSFKGMMKQWDGPTCNATLVNTMIPVDLPI